MTTEREFAYDRILYPSYLHSQTHPDRLAVMARFFGMSPAPVENCRVLELGCGNGSTLLAFALGIPDSKFVGIDLGAKQIALGKEIQAAAGIRNLELIHGDLMAIGRKELGEFDYIVAHGVYSWVPEPVRERVLQMCREMLAPQGVGFVSYNAYPGGHIRQMTREIMLYHTRALSEPHEKIQQSIAIMTFLANGANQGKLYQKMYDAELDTLRDRNPENIYHDDLSDANQPFYLYQFVENIGRHSLKYISDVQYFSTRDLTYPPDVIKALDSMGDDVVMREQYLDFLNCRRFRQSLICHHEVDLDRRPRVEMLEKLRMASRVKPTSEQPELASKKSEEFVGPKVENIEIDHSLTKAALSYLGQLWPRSASLNQIVSEAKQLLSKESGSQWVVNDNDEAILREIFMRIFGSGLIEFRTFEPRYADSVSDRPTVSPLARWQAERGETVFNLRYESLNIEDQLGLKLISVLDGTRDRDEILSEMMKFVRSPELRADDAERQKLEGELPQALDKKLAEMADLALLVE